MNTVDILPDHQVQCQILTGVWWVMRKAPFLLKPHSARMSERRSSYSDVLCFVTGAGNDRSLKLHYTRWVQQSKIPIHRTTPWLTSVPGVKLSEWCTFCMFTTPLRVNVDSSIHGMSQRNDWFSSKVLRKQLQQLNLRSWLLNINAYNRDAHHAHVTNSREADTCIHMACLFPSCSVVDFKGRMPAPPPVLL